MEKPKSDKISILFAVALFVGASLISLKYIGDISADIENGAAISPFKSTDFSAINDFSKSSWMAFSNLGDESPDTDDGRLKIINQDTKYQTMLAQPLMMSVNRKYEIHIKYEIKPAEDFSVKYGFVSNNVIGKPTFSSELDQDETEIKLEYTNNEPAPLSFQYFRALGSGEFNLESIKIEEIADNQTIAPSTTPVASMTPEATPTSVSTPMAIVGEALEKYSIKPGWNPFGYNQPVSSASFTDAGLIVYKPGANGWVVAKPNDGDSNFVIEKGSGVYILNETGRNIDISLSSAETESIFELISGWNILFSPQITDSNQMRVRLNGENKSLAEIIKENRMSRYIYSVDPAKPNDLIKINLERYTKIGAGQIMWVYLF